MSERTNSGIPGCSRGRRFVTAMVAVTLSVAGVAACDSDEEDGPAAPKAETIQWGACPAPTQGVNRDPRTRRCP